MRSVSQVRRAPEDRVLTVAGALHKEWTRTLDPGWTLKPHRETEEGRRRYEEREKKRAAKAAA